MNEKRKKMVDRMIKVYGFESPITIEFAELCERYADNPFCDVMLEILVTAHEHQEHETNPEYLDE